ncbi:FAD-binding oxidoreductase [Aurantimonas sp. C2-6-R+9]|uniref:NAD(P)/FAD-dependent oxidoreductase n=1 Tax=unclassified Aurantimonas TaxID=2638230 RepID=UPI002E19E437|nr:MULTISPECIES: FAD-binding oxidoreductase [unclassified Aurantimonas]MEC5292677.1 FAD-binding oxidoreductase [Aurantimonas sp. C2-3-R2]MEC5382897.1 FAD-binding oxidoreductase [Aurantimonas sp. C2-6-R+9]MEC5413711.1 FAD-binding oxidoreductase [Aurantimonas sp. C2-4-R8]
MNPSPDRKVDVAIVGSGIVGVSIAHALVRDGLTVTLVDREGVACGASRGNAGALAYSDVLPLASPGIMRKAPRWLLDPAGPLTIRPGYLLPIAPWLFRFWRASFPAAAARSMAAQVALMTLARSEMQRQVAEASLSHMLVSDGALELYESEAERDAARPNWNARGREGIRFEHVGRDAIDELQPGLDSRFSHGTFLPEWQSVTDPYDFAVAFADKLRERGVLFRTGEVTAVEPGEDGVVLRCVDGAAIRARQVVIAAGAWSKSLATSVGDNIPLDTERGYNTTLPRGAFDLRRHLTFGGHGFVVTRLSSGIRVGGAVEFGGLRLPPNMRRADVMLAKAKAFLPALDTTGGKKWMGYRPSLPDSLPVIGGSPRAPAVFYAFGHGHLGLTQSAATGRLIADLVAHRPTAIDVAPFRPDRF